MSGGDVAVGTAMRAVVLDAPGTLRTVEREVPVPAAGEVLVRVEAVGVCGSDVHYYEHGRIGAFVVKSPLVLGHEASGVVVAAGPEASHRPGTRVSLEPGIPDLTCEHCRAGRYNLCPDVRFFATPPVDGAFCEYVTLPEPFAHPVPDSLGFEAAALLEPLSVGVWACRTAGVGPGDRVLVTGAGPIGVLAAQVARAAGARVGISDVSPERLAMARRVGIDVTIDATTDDVAGWAPTVVLECSGNAVAAVGAISALRPAGRAVLVGMGAEHLELPVSVIQQSELHITGTFRYANTWPAAISLAEDGRVELDALVTHRYGLDEVEDALTIARRDPRAMKPVVLPSR